jgi:GGDEF domain-containing protein
MDLAELVIWSAMLGGVATLAAFALADALIRRSVASWRAFLFVALTGAACVLLTGLTRILLPDLPLIVVHTLQNSLGLLSGALSLSYLGLWMGVAAEDRIVRFTISIGSIGLVLSAGAMAALTLVSPSEDWHGLMKITVAINGLAVVLSAVVAIRGAVMGDQLAWVILADIGLLAFMAAGLYAHGLHISGLGTAVWLLTAVCTVAFFMLGTFLGIRRDRINRRLEHLAGLAQGADPATGLPKGSVLLSKVDDAIWRSARMNQECTVICLRLQNLYELAEIAGHNADQQILSAMSARMRRAVGFRNVAGLYHPRCFVVVMSTYSQTRLVEKTLQRLRYLMTKPLVVTGLDDASHTFVPRFGFMTVTADNCEPASVIDQAERLSLAGDKEAGGQPLPAAALSPDFRSGGPWPGPLRGHPARSHWVARSHRRGHEPCPVGPPGARAHRYPAQSSHLASA